LLVLAEVLVHLALALACSQGLLQVVLVTMVVTLLLALLAVAVELAELVKLDEAELQVLVELDTYHIDHLELDMLLQLVVALLQEELVVSTTLVVLEDQFLAIMV
jgi:hypothetical protein